jgi:hypothetical protein
MHLYPPHESTSLDSGFQAGYVKTSYGVCEIEGGGNFAINNFQRMLFTVCDLN